jgi:hypothetical protein
VDSRAGPDDVEKRTFCTLTGLELRSVVHPVASRYTAYVISGSTEESHGRSGFGELVLRSEFELRTIRIQVSCVNARVYLVRTRTGVYCAGKA